MIILLARLFGTNAVADMVRALEGDEEQAYAVPDDARNRVNRRRRARTRRDLGPADRSPRPAGTATGRCPRRDEMWHRGGRSGTLRAAVFGANDGLVSNLSLVMGVAGAAQAAAEGNHFIVLAGSRRPAGRRIFDGRGRVHQHAEPARAFREPDRHGARGDARHARGRARGAGRDLPRQGSAQGRGGRKSPTS